MANIADKIAKILAKADSTTNPEEAETFIAKAQELLQREGLTLVDVGKLQSDDPIKCEEDAMRVDRAEGGLVLVAHALASYYGCQSVEFKVNANIRRIGLAGRMNAILTFQLMYPFVRKQVRKLARDGHKAGDFGSYSKGLTAIGNSLAMRIYRMTDKVRAESTTSDNSNPNALVPVDIIEQALHEHWPNLREARKSTVKTSSAGRAAASKVSINRQATATGANRQIGR